MEFRCQSIRYKIYNKQNYAVNTDLSQIFQNIAVPLSKYTTTGTVTKTSDGSYNTILTWTSSGTITFYQIVIGIAPNAILTGGGAGGSAGSIYGVVGGSGSGGAAPNSILNMSSPTLNTTYSITVGAGGSRGTFDGINIVNPASGLSSIFAYTSTYTGTGGIAGTSGGGGVGGSNNTAGSAAGSNNSGGGGAGGSSSATQYKGGAGIANGGNGGDGGIAGGGASGKGVNGADGITPGGGGSNGSGYAPPIPTYSSGGNGASGSVVFKFNI